MLDAVDDSVAESLGSRTVSYPLSQSSADGFREIHFLLLEKTCEWLAIAMLHTIVVDTPLHPVAIKYLAQHRIFLAVGQNLWAFLRREIFVRLRGRRRLCSWTFRRDWFRIVVGCGSGFRSRFVSRYVARIKLPCRLDRFVVVGTQPDDSVMKQSCRFAHSVHARASGQALGPVVLLEEIIEGVVPGRIHQRAAAIEHSTEVRRVLMSNGTDCVSRRRSFRAD